jgi:hypothetical protein
MKSKLKVKDLKRFSLMVSGRYEGNKAELIERILKFQHKEQELKILIKQEESYELNPELNWDRLPVEYDSFHQAMQM